MYKQVYCKLIQSLESYRDGNLLGNELLELWESVISELSEFRPIYYNLYHLVSDEDIRQYDEKYKNMQINQLEMLISGLQNNESIEKLKQISFL